MEMPSGQSCALGKVVELPESQMSVCLPASLYVFLFLSNAGCLIINPPPPIFFGGGQHSNSKFLEPYGWDHDMYLIDSPCCFEKGFALLCFLQTSENKTRGSTIGIHYCHAWCRFIIAILGLVKGILFVDLFSCFFK